MKNRGSIGYIHRNSELPMRSRPSLCFHVHAPPYRPPCLQRKQCSRRLFTGVGDFDRHQRHLLEGSIALASLGEEVGELIIGCLDVLGLGPHVGGQVGVGLGDGLEGSLGCKAEGRRERERERRGKKTRGGEKLALYEALQSLFYLYLSSPLFSLDFKNLLPSVDCRD